MPDIILVACENIDRCEQCGGVRREQTSKLTVQIGIVYQFCVLTVRVRVALVAVLRGRAVRSHACAKIGQVVSAGRLAGSPARQIFAATASPKATVEQGATPGGAMSTV